MISRIKEVIAYYKLTDRAFAIKCGIKQNTLSRQLSGVSEISTPTINAILDNYKDISAEWLLRGTGNMLLSENQPQDESTERIAMLVDTITTLQKALNEQTKTNQLQTEQIKKLTGELAMLKNERNIK